MAETKIRVPGCTACEFNYSHSGLPQKKYGVMLHAAERYCIGGKRARMFKRRDPTTKAPDWCPKRINPHKVRIFGLKSDFEWFLVESMRVELGTEPAPVAHRYMMIAETTTELSAKAFWVECSYDAGPKLLGVEVPRHGIVEINDGLLPAYFYHCDGGYRYEPYFSPPKLESKQKKKGRAPIE